MKINRTDKTLRNRVTRIQLENDQTLHIVNRNDVNNIFLGALKSEAMIVAAKLSRPTLARGWFTKRGKPFIINVNAAG